METREDEQIKYWRMNADQKDYWKYLIGEAKDYIADIACCGWRVDKDDWEEYACELKWNLDKLYCHITATTNGLPDYLPLLNVDTSKQRNYHLCRLRYRAREFWRLAEKNKPEGTIGAKKRIQYITILSGEILRIALL